MADLSEVLGALLASVTQARRIADEETAALAEHYGGTPLLDGMSLPRIRLPEVVLELPVLIEEFRVGAEEEPVSREAVKSALIDQLQTSAGRSGLSLPKVFLSRFERELAAGLAPYSGKRPKALTAEGLARVVEAALLRAIEADAVRRFDDAQKKAALADLRRTAREAVAARTVRPPGIEVSVLTEAIKERTAPGNVSRLRMTLKEEGMEWTVVEQPDGSERRTLSPE